MASTLEPCPICRKKDCPCDRYPGRQISSFYCQGGCGSYKITDEAARMLELAPLDYRVTALIAGDIYNSTTDTLLITRELVERVRQVVARRP